MLCAILAASPGPVQAQPAGLAAVGVVRFVADDGVDAGDCTDRQRPCRTLAYAIAQAGSGDSVMVAAGTYAVAPEAATALLRPDISLHGGYAREPAFAWAAPGAAPSYVTGLPVTLRDALAARGLTLKP